MTWSGIDIAHWWIAKHAGNYAQVQQAEGFEIEHSGEGDDYAYTYVWLEAYVDHDMEQHYLLEVRTKVAGQHWETRDYLYVGTGYQAHPAVEWHNQPISFGASLEQHQERFAVGMKWFTDRILLSFEAQEQ